MRHFLRTALPLVAAASFGFITFEGVTTAGSVLGWDSRAYLDGAHRALSGAPLYDAASEVSYVTAIMASQLLSPVRWDHYAIILLIPVAWLLQRRYWWAVAIPLLTSIPSILLAPTAVYLVVFAAGLIGPLFVDMVERGDRLRAAAVIAEAA